MLAGSVDEVSVALSERNGTSLAGLEKGFQRWRGLDLGGRGKGYPSVSKGPKPPIGTTIGIAENSPREDKRAHFRYILGPPGPTQEMEFMGPGGEGPSRSPPPPRFLRPCSLGSHAKRIKSNILDKNWLCECIGSDVVRSVFLHSWLSPIF